VTAIGSNGDVSAAHNGVSLPGFERDGATEFAFGVTGAVGGRHLVELAFAFHADDADGARVEISIDNSDGSACGADAVLKGGGVPDAVFTFKVV
jgi:hypothetical protein